MGAGCRRLDLPAVRGMNPVAGAKRYMQGEVAIDPLSRSGKNDLDTNWIIISCLLFCSSFCLEFLVILDLQL